MARGDCQREFAAAAAKDGINLAPQKFSWLCQQGHMVLPPSEARELLEAIYLALGGDPTILATARTTPLPGDFVHPETGTLIEVDESQHITSARQRTLDLYTDDLPLGFDLARYKDLCAQWRATSDGYYRTKEARGFGIGGRQRQRAYYDALRDIAAPAMGHPAVVRIHAVTRDGAAAYRSHRDHLMNVLGEPSGES